MITLYRPVRIETAEQAEALPVGTIATSAQDAGGVWRKCTATSWAKASMKPSLWTNHGIANPDAAISALVPIEAEEETVVDTADLNLDPEHEYWSDDPNLLDAVRDAPKRTRLVTTWTPTEEA